MTLPNVSQTDIIFYIFIVCHNYTFIQCHKLIHLISGSEIVHNIKCFLNKQTFDLCTGLN